MLRKCHQYSKLPHHQHKYSPSTHLTPALDSLRAMFKANITPDNVEVDEVGLAAPTMSSILSPNELFVGHLHSHHCRPPAYFHPDRSSVKNDRKKGLLLENRGPYRS